MVSDVIIEILKDRRRLRFVQAWLCPFPGRVLQQAVVRLHKGEEPMRTVRKTKRLVTISKHIAFVGGVLFLAATTYNTVFAFDTYTSGCSASSCHGSFTGSTSPKGTEFPSDDKHFMHRNNSYMKTECDLCHTDIGDDPSLGSSYGTDDTLGRGCAGCHVGAGLRAHHAANGVTTCYTASCHEHSPEETPPAENVNPPYYGSVDTKADNACNDVLASKINENWSENDFLGLDNDGDNLYDLADFDCGPPYRIVGIEVLGNDIQINWETAGGRIDMLQAGPVLTTNFNDVGSAITNSGVGFVTNSTVEVGGATASNRFYKIRYAP